MPTEDITIWESDHLRIEVESSEIPWLKVFAKVAYKEMSEVPPSIKEDIYIVLNVIELEMLSYYKPTKINIASFGNYMPHLHWHIMARFEEDSYFPEPMWGERQREAKLSLPPIKPFLNLLKISLCELDRAKQPYL